jgi:hypothetical protein
MADLVVLLSKDVKDWCDYILGLFHAEENTLELTTACIDHEELLHGSKEEAEATVKSAKAILLLVSPYLYDVLIANPTATYKKFLKNPSQVVVLLLDGTSALDHQRQFPDVSPPQIYSDQTFEQAIECVIRTIDRWEATKAKPRPKVAPKPKLKPAQTPMTPPDDFTLIPEVIQLPITGKVIFPIFLIEFVRNNSFFRCEMWCT